MNFNQSIIKQRDIRIETEIKIPVELCRYESQVPPKLILLRAVLILQPYQKITQFWA